jgi:hypothetical protein
MDAAGERRIVQFIQDKGECGRLFSARGLGHTNTN